MLLDGINTIPFILYAPLIHIFKSSIPLCSKILEAL